jgi:hypothetical protein
MSNFLKISKVILVFLFLINLVSCKKLGLCDDKELSLVRKDINSNLLKTNGFYYGYADTDFEGVKLYETIVFYKNGAIMLPGTSEFEKLDDYILMISESNQSDTKFVWGLFDIESTNISLNHWVASQCGYPTVLRTGEIINDTTFILKKMKRWDSQGTSELDIIEEFHFRQLSIKPDSINNFIK